MNINPKKKTTQLTEDSCECNSAGCYPFKPPSFLKKTMARLAWWLKGK